MMDLKWKLELADVKSDLEARLARLEAKVDLIAAFLSNLSNV